MKQLTFIAFVAMLALIIHLAGCGNSGESYSANWTGFPSSLTLDQNPLSVVVSNSKVESGKKIPITFSFRKNSSATTPGNVSLKSSLGGKFIDPAQEENTTGINVFSFETSEATTVSKQLYYVPGNQIGIDTITAIYGNVTTQTTIEIVAAPLPTYNISIVAAQTTLKSGQETLLSIIITDSAGQPVPDTAPVLINSSMGNSVKIFGSTDAIGNSFTTTAGKAAIGYVAGATEGSDTVTAFYGAFSATITITIEKQSPYVLELIPASTTISVGSEMIVYVKIHSQTGKPLANSQEITVSVSSGTIRDSDGNTGSSLSLKDISYSSSITYTAQTAGNDKLRAISVDAEPVEKIITVSN